jgi:membrane-bound lytic murein transglycosylase D
MKSIVIFLMFLIVISANAQEQVVLADTVEIAIAEEEMLYKEDTLHYVYYALPTELEYIPGDDAPALVSARLSLIQKRIPLTYNDRVHAFINYFTVRDREYTRMVTRRKNLYFPLFEKYLAKYGLPDELKYLAIIESGLNPRAVSRARAVGLWQFMAPTGKMYGLHQDWYVDDRMDPEKSTDAACRYLRDLYRMFGDWELALASYNAGPGNVKKAIKRSGYKNSFWESYQFMPRETRSYVPQFVAIIYAMNYLNEHNFYGIGEEMLMPSDTLHVTKFLHLETLANLTGVCLEDLQKLNPSVKHSAVPDAKKVYTINIPSIAKENLELNRLAILDSASKVGRKEVEVLVKNSEGSTYGKDRIVYRVKSGDVLGSIAMRYGVSVNELKSWNNLSGTTIRVGQHLTVWQKPLAGSAIASSSAPPQPKPVVAPISSDVKTYVVQPGDTLWAICQRYEGLTVEKIKQLNKLDGNKIHAGQKLILAN